MKFLFLFGSAAVGKMTVGQALAKKTGFRLFHNHMTIEPILEIFGFYHGRVIQRFRNLVFEEFAASDEKGVIFTFIWAFDLPADWAYVEQIKGMFPPETEFYYVELVAPQNVRLVRNRTENRLNHKPSKRDLEKSEQLLLRDDEKYRTVSDPGEIPYENYLKIDNSELSPEEAAEQICRHFAF